MGEDGDIKTSEVWNVAKGFSNFEILEPILENTRLIKVALYGCEQINDSVMLSPELKTFARLEAIKRIHTNLENLHDSTKEFIKKEDKLDYLIFSNTLEALGRVLNDDERLSKIITDQRTKQQRLVIEEAFFKNVLDKLRKLNSDFLRPLNKANLIFPGSEDTDLDRLKEQIIEGG